MGAKIVELFLEYYSKLLGKIFPHKKYSNEIHTQPLEK